MGEPISAEERLVITLRYLSAEMSQQTLSYNFRVGRTTVSNIVKEVCDAIYNVLSPLYMNAPSTQDEWKHIAEDFEELWDMPHTIGAIDGKHIAIDCPKNTGSLFHNYKGFFSFVLLAVCDARYCFTFADVGQYGSNNDSGVLKESKLGQGFKNGSFNYPNPEKNTGLFITKRSLFFIGR